MYSKIERNSKIVAILLLIFIVYIGFTLRILDFKRPLGTYLNPMAEYFSYNTARLNLEQGISFTKCVINRSFLPAEKMSPEIKKENVYLSAGVLPTFISTICLNLFGDKDWATRIPSLIASLAVILFLYYLFSRLFGVAAGLLSALFLAILPADVYWGIFPFTFVYNQLFSLLIVILYYHYLKEKKVGYYFGIIGCMFLLGFNDIFVHIFVLTVFLHQIIFYKGRYSKKILALPVISALIFFLYLGYVYLVTDINMFEWMWQRFIERSNISSDPALKFSYSLANFYKIFFRRTWEFSNVVLTMLSYVSLPYIAYRAYLARREEVSPYSFILIFLLPVLIIYLIFWQSAQIHMNYIYYFNLFSAMCSAVVIGSGFKKIFLKKRKHSLVLGGFLAIAIMLSSAFPIYWFKAPDHRGTEWSREWSKRRRRVKEDRLFIVPHMRFIQSRTSPAQEIASNAELSHRSKMHLYRKIYENIDSISKLHRLIQDNKLLSIFYFKSIPSMEDSDEQFLEYLYKEYLIVKSLITEEGKRYFIFDLKSPAPFSNTLN